MNGIKLSDVEFKGLQEIKCLNKEYLKSDKCSILVRRYLEDATENEELLLRFLRGRKYRAKHAWETLKRYAEVKFDEYPEVFSQIFSDELCSLKESNIIGVLKSRDNLGRRIMFVNAVDWNPDEYSFEMITTASVILAEKLLLDDDGLNNGFVLIQQCSGVGLKHAQQYTLQAMRRLVNLLLYAFPLKLKEIYYINVPIVLNCAFSLIKPFLTKKLKDRLNIIGSVKDYQEIFKNIPLDILPKCFGGMLEMEDAVDNNFFELNN